MAVSSTRYLKAARDGFNEGYKNNYVKKRKVFTWNITLDRSPVNTYFSMVDDISLHRHHKKKVNFYGTLPKQPVIAGRIEKYRMAKLRKNENTYRSILYLFHKLYFQVLFIRLKVFPLHIVQKYTVHFIYTIYFVLIFLSYTIGFLPSDTIKKYCPFGENTDLIFLKDAFSAIILSLITFMAYENVRSSGKELEHAVERKGFNPNSNDFFSKK
jgi:hypothetical protein